MEDVVDFPDLLRQKKDITHRNKKINSVGIHGSLCLHFGILLDSYIGFILEITVQLILCFVT